MLVSPEWLMAHLETVVVLDASFHLAGAGRDADAEFLAAHIPGAQRFDIDEISDPESPLPHMLPSPEAFGRAVGALGIGNDTTVVVYEAGAPYSAPRAWWTFRAMGHDAMMLDGGLVRWRDHGLHVESGPARPRPPRTFAAHLRRGLVAGIEDVEHALARGVVVDARSAERFEGRAAEPRAGLRSGHMPGARNVHYAALVDANGSLKGEEELRAVFEAAGVDLAKPVVTTCGSGVTACVLAMALDKLGVGSAVYDGSWSEWGANLGKPVATGPAEPSTRS
jgi:thiosulfate/3-mercaptopyruvate sulfurtransferase